MFTGLVETTGALASRAARGPGLALGITSSFQGLELGESIAVSGVCLTVTEISAGGFSVDLSAETVARATLGRLPVGAELNLERSLRVGDRVGGHWVVGHVDGVAHVRSVTPVGESRRVILEPPSELLSYIAVKGSVTLDGVSLTVNALAGPVFEVMLIPHTLGATSLKHLAAGAELNLEVDLIARYAVRWLEATRAPEPPEPGLRSALERAGYFG